MCRPFALSIAVSLLATWLADPAASADSDVDEAAKIFDFSDLDVPSGSPAPKSIDPPAPGDPLPENVREVLRKWDRYQVAKQAEHRSKVVALRKVASEILLKRAAAATAAVRTALMEEAKQLTSIDPGTPVTPPPPSAANASLMRTSWSRKDGKSTWQFFSDGTVHTHGNKTRWKWIDEKRRVLFALWGASPNLCLLTGDRLKGCDLGGALPDKMRSNTSIVPPSPIPAAPSPVVAKLAADEIALADELSKLFAGKRSRIAAFLRAQVKDATGAAVTALMEKAAQLEPERNAPQESIRQSGDNRITGEWKFPGGRTGKFKADGTASVEGLGTGRWELVMDRGTAFVVVIRDRSGLVKTDDHLLLGRFSESEPGTVRIVTVGGKKYDIRK